MAMPVDFLEFFKDACTLLAVEMASEIGPYIHAASSLTGIAKTIAKYAAAVPLGNCSQADRDRWLADLETECIDVLRKAAAESDESVAEAAIQRAAQNLDALLHAMPGSSKSIFESEDVNPRSEPKSSIRSAPKSSTKVIKTKKSKDANPRSELRSTLLSVLESTTKAVIAKKGIEWLLAEKSSTGERVEADWLESVEDWAEFLFRLTMVEPQAVILLEQPRVESLREFFVAKRHAVFAPGRPFVLTSQQQPSPLSEGDSPPERLEATHVEALRQRYQQVFERFPAQSVSVSPLWKAWLRAVHGPTLEAWTKELREAVR